jgi:Phage P22-like portal protein
MPEPDIPLLARRAWYAWRSATKDQREAEEESLGMWVGGEKQWRPAEIASRRGNNRPWTSINRCKPAVDQVENEAASNPPGPEAYPVGNGADKDGCDVLEGLIREYEYRSDATNARLIGLRYAMAGGSGVYELCTEYRPGRTMEQCISVNEIEDPATVFSDPNARLRHRQDQMVGGRIRRFTKAQLQEQYPEAKNLKIFNRGLIDRAAGWMQDAFPITWKSENATSLAEWINPAADEYYVCEFYRVTIEKRNLYLCTDEIIRYEDEMQEGDAIKLDSAGQPIMRTDPVRKVWKHVVTALDELVPKTEWPGEIIPLIWLLGPEIYVKGKLHRLSLLSGAIGAQRSLNYTATSMNEIVGLMTKSPFVGWQGQFDVTNAQGFNPWEASNTSVWAYMEVKPTFAVHPDGRSELLPAPQRNVWEAPIARLFEALTFWGEQIKAATSIFFDPTQQSARDVQSGEAIKALQSQTNIGTSGWQKTLQSACTLEYQEARKVFRKLYDGARVVTIVQPDSTHELAWINQNFKQGEVDPRTGKPGKNNDIINGEFAVRVTAGPSYKDRTDKAIEKILELVKVDPDILKAPGVAGQILRWLGEGNPEVEQIADSLTPGGGQDATPQQLQAQLAQASQQNQQLKQLALQLHQAIQAKLPQIEADKWKARLDALTKIRVAEINASKDADHQNADREADAIESLLGMAHERATQAVEHNHAQTLADKQAATAAVSQASDQQHQQQMAEQQQENEPEPAGANQ